MRSNKLSQEVMADKIGVSQKTLSYWLTGKSHPTAKKVIKITEICDEYEKGNETFTKGNEKSNDGTKGNKKCNKNGNEGEGAGRPEKADDEKSTKTLQS